MSNAEAASVAAPGEPCIFAVASGSGRAAIAVLRLSGARTGSAIEALCRTCPPPRRASLRSLHDGAGTLIDRALVLWMPGPDSYTGEDCAELHVHGGHAVIDAVAGALIQAGARPADPGEFSRRAFLNGRMDLLEAEGVADLVEAETEAQRRQALRQMQGEASRLYRGWAGRLLSLLAAQEALVDFPDEDLPASVEAELRLGVAALAATLRAYLDDGHRGERLRDGVVIAITGQPNVGKSSLMNALCERDVAIVSPQAGTTRDVLEARLVLRGVPVTLLDTAGLRPSDDAIEQEGVRRARDAAAGADLVVHLLDPTLPDMSSTAGAMRVSSKADLGLPAIGDATACSAYTGHGMADLREQLGVAVERLVRNSGPPAITRARHRAGLTDAVTHLEAAGLASLPELRAEALRLGYQALGRLTGAGDVETILDEVFGRFCIGK